MDSADLPKTRQLLIELMAKGGTNPNRLTAALKGAVKQPQIHRFIRGATAEPRRSTLQPVAEYFGVHIEAFFDESLAAEMLSSIATGEFSVQRQPRRRTGTSHPPVSAPSSPTQDSIATLVQRLAEHMNGLESSEDRDALASRLQTLARAPDSPRARADVVRALEPRRNENTAPSVAERVLKADLTTESKDIYRQGASSNVGDND